MKYLVGFFSLEWMRIFDFLAPLAIRLFLAPVFWVAGVRKLGLFSSADFLWWNPMTWTNADAFQQSVAATSSIAGMTADSLVLLIGSIEIAAAILLILGFGVRWVALALIVVVVLLGLLTLGNGDILTSLQNLVMTHGYLDMTNNIAEVYLAYFVLLLALFFMGGGRWVSLDWYIYRHFQNRLDNANAVVYHDPFEIDATDEPLTDKK